ncbi:MAG: RsmD family RNA methyltransferase [Actinomycetota bacterium]|nr:RsmD family RNA methyltransferase [Actinomycetota bacterium]
MRVIAGTAKGIRLAPVPEGTRPLADRAREGLFSSLGPAVRGARVLDLFAGTGAIGVEALSRGAEHAVFVDASAPAIRTVQENLRRTRLGDRATVLRRDAGRAVGERPGSFGVVFMDPPYAYPATAVERLIAELDAWGLVEEGCLVVLTRSDGSYTPVIPLHWLPDRRLSYGDAFISVFHVTNPEAAG